VSSFAVPKGPRAVAEIHEEPDSGARITLHAFRHEDGEWIASFERVMPPHTGRARGHRHADFEQSFKVLSGRAAYRLGRTEGVLEAGEELLIPIGVPHVEPHNPFDQPLELISAARPMRQPVLVYIRTLGNAIRRGEVNDQQEFGFLQQIAVVRECGMRTYLTGLPMWLQRFVGIPLLGRLGRLRGYRASAW